ncbi:PaaI family thioesterase [Verminephrobacter aporrectodeae]|uniref:PaaI family thioesterase n=1 Tax=Verminephrobacter aporrectodeae TaxID=1110389 RepID=UPI002242D37D|nr:PaaI family thioesterase [Verminephrobacter aporrectodeae]
MNEATDIRAVRLPFVDHVGIQIVGQEGGRSECRLEAEPHHTNALGSLHGAVLFTLADTGMGAAAFSTLATGEGCATIEAKIQYFRPARVGQIVCTSEVVHRSRSIVHTTSSLCVAGVLVAQATGSFAIFPLRLPLESGVLDPC